MDLCTCANQVVVVVVVVGDMYLEKDYGEKDLGCEQDFVVCGKPLFYNYG